MYYSYLHCTPDGLPFYVGSGKNNRCFDFIARHENHKAITKKYGEKNIRVYVFKCESREDALRDEKQQIAQLYKEGYDLVNINNIFAKQEDVKQLDHNKKLAEQGRKRAEMFLRLHINKKIPVVELARRYGMSRQRMSYLIKKASGGHG